MFSTINWVNRDTSANGFDANYGMPTPIPGQNLEYYWNAAAASQLVDLAIAHWEAAIQNFNYDSPSHTELDLTINAVPVSQMPSGDGVVLGYTTIDELDDQGKPLKATITVAGTDDVYTSPPKNDYWVFPTNYQNNPRGSKFGYDFYATILHEIGHAVGIDFGNFPVGNTALKNAVTPAPGGDYTLSVDSQTVTFNDTAHVLSTAADLMQPANNPPTITELDLEILRDVYKYTTLDQPSLDAAQQMPPVGGTIPDEWQFCTYYYNPPLNLPYAWGISCISQPLSLPPGTMLTPNTAPVTITATEGSSTGPQVVAIFSDNDPLASPANYVGVIDWGDGYASTFGSSAVQLLSGSTFTVTGSHTYQDKGNYLVKVTINYNGATDDHAVVAQNTNVKVFDRSPPTVSSPSDQAVPEGILSSIDLGSLSDSDGGPWTVDVNWGDGTPDTGFTASAPGPLTPQSHSFREEESYTVTVTATDTSDGAVRSSLFHVSVSDPAVVQGPAVAVSAVEGAAFTGKTVAQFTDPGGAEPNPSDPTDGILSHYQVVSINWGDGTPLDTTSGAISFSGIPGSKTDPFTVSGSHTYGEEGNYTITAVIDHEGVFTTLTGTATVLDAALTSVNGGTIGGVEGVTASLSGATFTDAAGTYGSATDFTATINWGDGSPTSSGTVSGSGGSYSVAGMHTYAEEGTYAIVISVTDDGGAGTIISDTATVADAALMGSSTTTAVGTEGVTNSSVLSGATFTDANLGAPSTDFTATITWGDGGPTSSGTVSGSGGSYSVAGMHTYAEEGIYNISIAVMDEGGSTATITGTATIKDDLGLLLLDPTGSQSLMVTGNADVTVTGVRGGVVVDSNDATKAAFVTGNGVVTAGDFDVTGGVFRAGNGVVPSPVDHETPTPNPLSLGLPSPLPPAPVGNTATVLNPGTYVGGLHLSGKNAVTLQPGVYVMEGGGFSVTGQASVMGSGVVIINIPSGPSDTISVSGKGVVTLSAPGIGQPFQGVAVFQNPASANPVSFSGQATVKITGVVYTPAAPVSITGNAVVTINFGPGTATLPPILGAMIAYDLQASGNGVLTINPDDPPSSSSPMAAADGAGGGAADVHSAALAALASGDGLTGPGTLTDQEAMNEVAMSLAGITDLSNGFFNNTKKKG